MGYGGHTPAINSEIKDKLTSFSEKLLPCPLCGEKVYIKLDNDVEGDDMVTVKCCICYVSFYFDNNQLNSINTLINVWNKRKY